MYLGREVRDILFRLKEPAMEQRTSETLKVQGDDDPIDPSGGRDALGGQRQSGRRAGGDVELKLVILDEPTAALGVAQTEQVLELVRRLAEQGSPSSSSRTTCTTSSRRRHAITVLRLGRNVGVYERAKTTQQEVARDHRRNPDEGRRCRRGGRRGRGMSTVDVAASGHRPAGGRRAGGHLAASDRKPQVGNLGVLPVVIGEILIVAFFSFTATNFFTASNFVNVILQMAGVTMIAFGVVFVLLIAEIDLSIGYLSGIAALTAATLQLPGRSQPPGWLCILIALGVVAIIGAAQGTIVAKVGCRRSSSRWPAYSSGRA